MDPIDTSALPVAAQMQLSQLSLVSSEMGTLEGGGQPSLTSSADLGASLFSGAAYLDLSPAAQALIGNEGDNEQTVTDAAHSIGLTDWPG